MYNEQFRIPDGGRIRVEYPDHPEWDYTAICKYIDDYHTSINNRVFHICEFAELMQRNGCVVRSEAAWAKDAENNKVNQWAGNAAVLEKFQYMKEHYFTE